MLRVKNKEVKEWLQQSVNSLKGVTTNIDDFVRQSMALKQIQKKFPQYKMKVQLIGHLYTIMDGYGIEVKKEDKQAYVIDTIQASSALDLAIHNAEEGAERNLERFARDVQNVLIPTLEKSIGNLD